MQERPDATMARDVCPTRTAPTRRSLFGALAAGFALSASGLYLPEIAQESEAKGGANGGKLGGRHGKDRRGKHQDRDHGERKDKARHPNDRPGTSLGLRDIAYEVHVARSLELYIRVHSNEYTLNPGETRTFNTSGFESSLELRFIGLTIWARNLPVGYPKVWIQYFACDHFHQCVDKTLAEAYMKVNQVLSQPTFDVKRLDDDDDYIRFRVNVTS